MSATSREPLLSVRDLRVAFESQSGSREVLHGVSFDIFPGETIAIVGESGSGKSTTASALIQLLPGTGHVTSGTIMLGAEDLTLTTRRRWRTSAGARSATCRRIRCRTSTRCGRSASR
jgi:peptide/nickel transport system ATP-binding protein